MTKLRAPTSFEHALTRIAGALGWARMAEIVDQVERTVRNWSDPDTTARISLADAHALDVAYRAAGGEGYPIHDCYRVRLDLAEMHASRDTEALACTVAAAAKEGGEAIAALVVASRPGASPAERAIAVREVSESIAVLTSTLPMLDPAGTASAPAEGS